MTRKLENNDIGYVLCRMLLMEEGVKTQVETVLTTNEKVVLTIIPGEGDSFEVQKTDAAIAMTFINGALPNLYAGTWHEGNHAARVVIMGRDE